MIHAFIITGFLGSGKSTLLTDTVKKHFKDKNIAIIVNEFGEVGIDQTILKNVHSDVIQISDGCICCQLSEEFESGVIEIINKFNPDIIFVETAGITEPFPIFMSMQNLGLIVDGVICVVDAKNYASYMHNSTAKYQVGGANIIVLNKTDLTTQEELAQAKKDITVIKEEFNIKSNFTGKTVFNNYFLHTIERGILNKEVFEGVYQVEEIVGLAKEYHHTDHITNDSIIQKIAKINREVCFNEVDSLLNNLPRNIYRAKGIIKMQDVLKPLVVNYSFGNVTFEELDQFEEDSIFVFIGEDIDKDVIELAKKFDYLNVFAHEHHHH
ncbi:MAG: GTP-binding protein [Sulfurimonas sp.]|nr:GTP-binding protein [Sulfurimonas sp.]